MKFIRHGQNIFKIGRNSTIRVGHIRGQWYITRRRKEHFFVKLNGFGLSQQLIELLVSNSIKMVKINYFGSKHIIYNVPLSFFLNESIKSPFADTSMMDEDLQQVVSVDVMEEKVLS